MFTGIIEDKGLVLRVEPKGKEKRLFLELPVNLTEVHLGDSINVNGVCLTVAEKKGQTVAVDLSSETIQKTTLGRLMDGEKVNLERALKLSDRLGGHLVTGHIDGIGVITEKRKERDFFHLKIRVPQSILRYVIQKGSIAIDGISLTVNDFFNDGIHLTIIPYTLQKTTLIDKKVGNGVNVEADVLGKYVEKMLNREEDKDKRLGLTFLKEHGFIENDEEKI